MCHAGHWSIVTTWDGSRNISGGDLYYSSSVGPWSDSNGNFQGTSIIGTSYDGSGECTVTSKGKVKSTGTWVSDGANDSAPEKVTVRESVSASWIGGSKTDWIPWGTVPGDHSHSGHISAGISGTTTPNGDSFWGGENYSGTRTRQINSNNGTFQVECEIDTEATTNNTGEWEGPAAVDCNYSVEVINRYIKIVSSREANFHREVVNGVPTKVENTDDGASLHADSVGNIPDVDIVWPDSQGIDFDGLHFGDWFGGVNQYKWTWSVGHHASILLTEGEWYTAWLSGINPLNLGYYEHEGNAGSEEHINLKATDGGDGISSEYDYYVKFHEPAENVVTLHNTSSPTPPAEGATSAGEGWISWASGQGPCTLTRSEGVTTEVGGEVSIEGFTGADQFLKLFGVKVGIKVNSKHTHTVTVTCGYPVPEHVYRTCYYAMKKIHKDGTCSVWNYNGYDHDGGWSGDEQTEEVMYCFTDIPTND